MLSIRFSVSSSHSLNRVSFLILSDPKQHCRMGPSVAAAFLALNVSGTGALAAAAPVFVMVAKRAWNCLALSVAIFLCGVKIRCHLAHPRHTRFGGCLGDCNNTSSIWWVCGADSVSCYSFYRSEMYSQSNEDETKIYNNGNISLVLSGRTRFNVSLVKINSQ